MPRALISLSNLAARVLSRAAEALEDWSRHLNRCPDCGRSRYYGRPCVGENTP